MIQKFASKEEIQFINKFFFAIDKNADGFITKDEFCIGYEKIMGNIDK